MKFEILGIAEEKPDAVSAAIMELTDSDFSHVAIRVGGKEIYHAVGKGFCREPNQEVQRGHVIKRCVVVVPREKQFAMGWLKKAIGTEYSQSQYIGFGLLMLAKKVSRFRWLSRKLTRIAKRFDNGTSKTICSEVGMDFLEDCCGLVCAANSDFVTPKECLEWASQIGEEQPCAW